MDSIRSERGRRAFAAVLLGGLLLTTAARLPGALRLDAYAGAVREFTLANGLHVVVIEDAGSPVVAACFTVRGGYADDPAGQRGLASMAPLLLQEGPEERGSRDIAGERLAVKAMNAAVAEARAAETKPGSSGLYERMQSDVRARVAIRNADAFVRPRFAVKALEHYGAREFHATASADAIQWWVRMPANRVDAFLLLYGEWLRAPFPRLMYQAKERRMREFTDAAGTADQALRRTLLAAAFGPQGYGLLEVEPAELERLQRSDAEAYLKSRLVAANLTLTLAGGITEAEARALASRYLEKIPAGTRFVATAPPAPPLQAVRAAPPKETPGAMVAGYRRPPEGDPDDPVFDVIAQLMLDGPSSRFRTGFLKNNPLLTGMAPSLSMPGSRQGGLMLAVIPYHPSRTPKEWTAMMGTFFEELGGTPVSESELDAARRSLEDKLLNMLADPAAAAQYIGSMGGWKPVAALVEAWSRVTPESLRAAAARFIKPEARVVLEPGLPAAAGEVK
ncbi:MAG: insulinase family protein [Bryobacterales bacterium]|nr:insulinase family protein [Bryobacterales bacterium]